MLLLQKTFIGGGRAVKSVAYILCAYPRNFTAHRCFEVANSLAKVIL